MKVDELLTYVERRSMEVDTKVTYPDKPQMMKYLSMELLHLSSLEEWDFLCVHANPIVTTSEGERVYALPEDFGVNFIRSADDEWWSENNEISHMCRLDDLQTESYLRYQSPARFWGRNIRGEVNSRPTVYTIQVTRGGTTSEIVLGPTPDSNNGANYLIRGVYIPTDWTITEKAQTPPLPGNSMYLVDRLLAVIFHGTENQIIFEQKAAMDLQSLYLNYARNRRTRMRPGSLRDYAIYSE